jgi:hypothetical protein
MDATQGKRAYGHDEPDSYVHVNKYDGTIHFCGRELRRGDVVVDPRSIRWTPDIRPDMPMCPEAMEDPDAGPGMILKGMPDPLTNPTAVCWQCLQAWEMTCDRCFAYGFDCNCPCRGCEERIKETGDPDAICMDCMGFMIEAAEREAGWDATP